MRGCDGSVSVPRVTGGASEATSAPAAEAPVIDAPVPADPGLPERRPGDVVRLVGAIVGMVLAGLWAQSGNDVDANLFAVVNGLPDAFEGVANVFAALGRSGSPWWSW